MKDKTMPRSRKWKLSEVLQRFLDGSGGERELENYMHANLSSEEEEEFLNPLMDISKRYRVGLQPGVFNPDSHEEIRGLAKHLSERGL